MLKAILFILALMNLIMSVANFYAFFFLSGLLFNLLTAVICLAAAIFIGYVFFTDKLPWS